MTKKGFRIGNLTMPSVLLNKRRETSVEVTMVRTDKELILPPEILNIRDETVKILKGKGRIVSDGESFCWASVHIHDDGNQVTIDVELGKSRYFNSLLSTVFDVDISGDDPDLKNRLSSIVDVDRLFTPEGIGMHPLSTGVGVCCVLITSDGFTVLTKRSEAVALQPGRLHPATAEGFSLRDLSEGREISLRNAIRRSLAEELNITELSGEEIFVHGLAVDLNIMRPAILAEIRIPFTWEDIRPGQEHSPDKWEHEKVWPVRFSPNDCAQELGRIEQWTGGSHALTLSLIREFGEEAVKDAFNTV